MPKQLLIIILVFCGCGLSNIETRPLVFSNQVAIHDSILSIIKFDSILYTETKISENEVVTAEFIITIVNPQSLPADSARMDSVAKIIAITAKNYLKNLGSYNLYTVNFYSEKEMRIGVLRTSKSFPFNQYDLR